MHKTAELTSHYFILRVLFAPKATHVGMVGVDREDPFSTLIANCSIILIYNLSRLGMNFEDQTR